MKIHFVTMDEKYTKNVTKIIKRDLLYKLAERIMQVNDDLDNVKKIEKYIEGWQSREIQINYCRESLIAYLEYIKGIKKQYNRNPFIDFLSDYLKTNCKKEDVLILPKEFPQLKRILTKTILEEINSL